MAEQWFLRGDYVENCNCHVSCPCTMSMQLNPSSDDGSCHVTLAFNVRDGRYGAVDLGGLGAVLVANTPPGQAMGQGNWSVALYLDERATAEQRDALATIFSGQAGGLFGALGPLIGTTLGVKPARIDFGVDGQKRSVRIAGFGEATVEPIPGPINRDQPITLNNMNFFNPAAPLTQAIAVSNHYRDYGLAWDNSGRNAYVTTLDLKGP